MRFNKAFSPRPLTKIVTALALLTAAPLWAQAAAPICQDVLSAPAVEWGPQHRVQKELDAPTPYKAKDFEAHLDTLDQLIGDLVPAKDVVVTIGSKFEESHYNPAESSIYIGIRTEIYPKGEGFHPAKNFVILSHEYGHATLEKNLILHVPAFKNIHDELLRIVEVQKRAQAIIAEGSTLEAQQKNATDDKTKAEIQARLDVLTKEYNDLVQNTAPPSEALRKFAVIRSAAHEFFADIMAIARHKDPEMIKDVVKEYDHRIQKASVEDLTNRDFTPEPIRKSMKNWQKQLATSTDQPYFDMDPSRWALWQLVKTHIDSDNYRRQILPKTYKALEKVMTEVLSWDNAQLGITDSGTPDVFPKIPAATFQKINDMLIKELQATL